MTVSNLRYPAFDLAGLREVDIAPARVVDEMVVPGHFRDCTGAVVPGVLGILGDSAMGDAVMTTVPLSGTMMTSHFHLEIHRRIGTMIDILTCTGSLSDRSDSFARSTGTFTAPDGSLVATATSGGVLVDIPDRAPMLDSSTQAPMSTMEESTDVDGRAQSPVLQLLGAAMVSTDDGLQLAFSADARFSNSSGVIHGGFEILMGEQLLHEAVRRSLPDGRLAELVELRVAFLRPIIADGSPVVTDASVLRLGRRTAVARGQLLNQQGREAVLVDASYLVETEA
jgi:uncharacterized protein (TIGR00369 family)